MMTFELHTGANQQGFRRLQKALAPPRSLVWAPEAKEVGGSARPHPFVWKPGLRRRLLLAT